MQEQNNASEFPIHWEFYFAGALAVILLFN